MRKVVAGINITLDGFCDHTEIIPDDEMHDHYTGVLNDSGVVLYGRTTFELMEYWKTLVENPSGEKSMDDFAIAMDAIPKVVFSHTWKRDQKVIPWETARLATKDIRDEIQELKSQPGKDILIGSPGLIAEATNLNLIDEYQLCIHPVIVGKGLPLFKNISDKVTLKLTKTKTFGFGAVVHYYQTLKK